ncbi:MAG TPA: hypothetical protein VEV45_03660 [Streptosporangiaceae bacterium]|nr:hypothetical protein [Streptosporangiaceae bacterium]
MAKFLVTYHGGGEPPADPAMREQMMAAFGAWAASVGENMIDPGAPLGPAKAVTSSDVRDDDNHIVEGYTVLSAGSLADAVALVRSHPFVSRGGTLVVSEAVAP